MNEPYPGYTCITDEQYELVAEAGKLPKDQSVELKKALDFEISHFRLQVK